jgi:integrase
MAKYNLKYNPSNKQFYCNYTEGGKQKREYFGTGSSKSDRPAKAKAELRRKIWIAEREQADMRLLRDKYYSVILAGEQTGILSGTNLNAAVTEKLKQPENISPPEIAIIKPPATDNVGGFGDSVGGLDDFDEDAEQVDAVEMQAGRLRVRELNKGNSKPKADKGVPTIADHIKAWLEFERSKVGTEELSAKSYENKVKGIQQFEDHANGDSFADSAESMLANYRAKLDAKIASGEYKGNTGKDKIKHLRVFIKWCWKNRHLKEMPRNMDDVCRSFNVTKSGDPMDLPDIKKLWSAASDRQKCFIALGLNLGMKPGDITALKSSQLQGDRLLGYRPKTKAPFNMKLWPVTVDLIAKCRDRHGDDEHIFVNQAGGRIATDSFGQVYKKTTKRAKVYQKKVKSKKGESLPCIFSQLRDTSVDLFEKRLAETGHDGGLKRRFLQQSETDNTVYYTNHEPSNMQSDKLDEITDYIGAIYKLEL